jgi:hypothetical protein
MSNEGWGVNLPYVESSDLTTARKVVPHTTLRREKRLEVWEIKGKHEGKRKRNSRKNTE